MKEGANAERVAKFFRHNGHVKIPQIRWEHSSRRILCMEFCPGAQVTDVAFMKRAGIPVKAVSRELTRIFSEMIFVHGFVHWYV